MSLFVVKSFLNMSLAQMEHTLRYHRSVQLLKKFTSIQFFVAGVFLIQMLLYKKNLLKNIFLLNFLFVWRSIIFKNISNIHKQLKFIVCLNRINTKINIFLFQVSFNIMALEYNIIENSTHKSHNFIVIAYVLLQMHVEGVNSGNLNVPFSS